MPCVVKSDYKPPRFCTNPHFQTIYASVLRNVRRVQFHRERIDTPDGDFIDLDWSQVGSNEVAILVHGLEGASSRTYMCGMTQALNRRGIDVVCINLRGCSNESNRLLLGYDLGTTHDLELVSAHVAARFPRKSQYLVGFSLGGNLVLKYLGERAAGTRPQIQKAVAFSVPSDFASAASVVHSKSNRLYYYRFMLSIHKKMRQKHQRFPGMIPEDAFRFHPSFKEFNDFYTVPLYGYGSTEEYWEKSSCKNHLSNIQVPTLLINAQDDPLIGNERHASRIAQNSGALYFESPRHGGHVGFVSFNSEGEYWSEKRASEFLLKDV